MKKILFSIMVVMVAAGCEQKKNISYADVIKTYIEKDYPESNINIIQISEQDSIYDSFDDVVSLYKKSLNTLDGISELSGKAWESESKKQTLLYLDSAMAKYNEDHKLLDSLYSEISIASQFPEYKLGLRNIVAIRAIYRIDKDELDSYFYLDGDSVDNSSTKNMEIVNEVKDCLFKIAEKAAEIQKDIIEIQSGKTSSAAWN